MKNINNIDLKKLNTLIFDLDGVITSEIKYWNTAKLTVWELICSDNYLGLNDYFGQSLDVSTRLLDIGKRIIPNDFIYQLKSRAINSNWDLTFFVFSLHLLSIFQEVKKNEKKIFELFKNDHINIEDKLKECLKSLNKLSYNDQISENIIKLFWQETQELRGNAVLNNLYSFSNNILGDHFSCFDSKGELWKLCYHNFQNWYEGKKGYTLPDDETVLDVNKINHTLKILQDTGHYTLAIATGRPRNEVIQPLKALRLLQYFDQKRIVTYDEVLDAESKRSNSEEKIKLGKPHPFILLKAIYPDENIKKLCNEKFTLQNNQEIAYIGDAGSDVVAAKRAGCISIGVLTGFATGKQKENKEQMLKDLGCDIILESILELPQLLEIQQN